MAAENSICSKRASLAPRDPIVTKSASEPKLHAETHTIWHFLKIDMSDGRIVTERMDAGTLLRILRALGNRHLEGPLLHEFLSAMDKIEDRMEDRNFVVHGTWGTLLPENIPVALSLRPKALPGEVMSETFPRHRMHEIVRDVMSGLEFLMKLMPQLKTLPRKSDEPTV
jgi:hypothetical protein